jgi:hypothetical protein
MLPLPLEAKLIGAALLVAAVLGWFAWHDHQVRADATASIRAEVAQATIKAQQEAAAETNRRITASKEQDHEDAAHAERVVDSRAALDASIGRLRERAAAGVGPSDPAASAVGSGIKAAGVSAGLFDGLAQAARRYADIAESALSAAESCAARYDALTP